MKHRLENEWLEVEVLSKGAEWCRFRNIQTGIDYLWSADPQVWGKYAPLLFPIVGTLRDGKFVHNGNEYALSRHGFARDREFELVEQDADQLVFELKADETSLSIYPFPFKLRVRYRLSGFALRVEYTVINEGGADLYFSIGGHPAFRIPFFPGTQYDDYHLRFEKPEQSGRWPISAAGLIEREPLDFFAGQQILTLSKQLFEKDALVFKHLESSYVDLVASASGKGLRFHFGEFPYLGLWAAPGADFLCIEPWQGIADSVDHNQLFSQKEGVKRLSGGEIYKAGWTVELLS